MSRSGSRPPAPDPKGERGGLTRRQFVGTGAAVAVGAAVVWTSEFPFADSLIGQSIGFAAGPTGPTGPTGAGTGAANPVPAVPRVTG
jgi:hypothetical protein